MSEDHHRQERLQQGRLIWVLADACIDILMRQNTYHNNFNNFNNLDEQDHRVIKRINRPLLGFKSF